MMEIGLTTTRRVAVKGLFTATAPQLAVRGRRT